MLSIRSSVNSTVEQNRAPWTLERRPPLRTEQCRMNAKILTIASAIVACMLAFTPASAQNAPAAPDQPAAGAPAAPDAAAPGGAAGVATANQQVENPYGFKALVEEGDFGSPGVLAALSVMSPRPW